jgi:hypothetical protein
MCPLNGSGSQLHKLKSVVTNAIRISEMDINGMRISSLFLYRVRVVELRTGDITGKLVTVFTVLWSLFCKACKHTACSRHYWSNLRITTFDCLCKGRPCLGFEGFNRVHLKLDGFIQIL